MKTTKILSLAIGSAFAAATLSPLAHAAGDNPFSASKLEAGYQLAQADTKMKDGKCGEAKCGADKKAGEKMKDGKCGEAKCGADKKGADKKKDGKCGEAKCGADKKK
ncbi:HvfA family oxazolone/thioamide-modified RiPP metallophore [Ferribacterium limneticum]|jgi:uncharacterized low-complexity protein|uniref:HvfA family oxazolone/thioamide-modified RiPP metallophore n=1 Tax=Ferribacterium limneticum TaxID=76259 RepID=UPI0008C0CCF9|nr:hypothetical protein [Ferribacterium limneticum]OHC65752.1 MAG: hypothetical protein A2040_03065 [Rhodocyclales bacterium GWA2_65_19]TXT31045.1 MAG: hypothetical protein FD131_1290 [Rhodocyclaceae bacterium]UCV18244.1 hypothetical protein KI610_15765 [Ferribacterium limneticum]